VIARIDTAVRAIVDVLEGSTISVADGLATHGLPETDGFYAWWASEQVLRRVPPYPHRVEALRLLYVGIAPGA
jgi:hypothetical protein